MVKRGEAYEFPPRVEVLPVPVVMVLKIWPDIRRRFEAIPGFDAQRLQSRLLLGADRLWLAADRETYLGVIVTTVSNEPPSTEKPFKRATPEERRSLTVYLADGEDLPLWIDSAVQRITQYGVAQGCRMLFIKARKGWRQYATYFYSREHWSTVAYSRDRATQAEGVYKLRNQPDFYRVMKPVEDFKRQLYNTGTMCYFNPALVPKAIAKGVPA